MSINHDFLKTDVGGVLEIAALVKLAELHDHLYAPQCIGGL